MHVINEHTVTKRNVSVINSSPPPYLGYSGMISIYRKKKKKKEVGGGDFNSRDNLSLVLVSHQQTQHTSSVSWGVNDKDRKLMCGCHLLAPSKQLSSVISGDAQI